jgi:hypothetical protein
VYSFPFYFLTADLHLYRQLIFHKETNVFTISSNTEIFVQPHLLVERCTGDCLLQLSGILGQAVDSGMWTLFLTRQRHRVWVNGNFTDCQL